MLYFFYSDFSAELLSCIFFWEKLLKIEYSKASNLRELKKPFTLLKFVSEQFSKQSSSEKTAKDQSFKGEKMTADKRW